MAHSLFSELKRRNVLRAAVLYAGAVWALAQGLSQLLPLFGDYEWIARWFVIAACVGFPFWIVFAWFYEFTPHGLKRESEVAPDHSVARSTGRKLDKWIIAVLMLAVVLLATDQFATRREGVRKTAVAGDAKSIAVLPLINESGDPGEQYFSDGLSEELISALGQVRDLKVIGRSSSFRFRGKAQDDSAGIGTQLGVATLLEGTVRKQGDQVRIVASLIKASDGSQLWSQTYDRQLKDVFAVQSDVATSVADELKAGVFGQAIQMTDKPPGGNLAAYDAMLQGQWYAERRNRADYLKAVGYYQQAIALDPDYALAYARLAIAQQWFNDWMANREERKLAGAQARANALKAVALAPRSATALGALGVVQAWTDFDYPAAEATLKKAVALDPSNAETWYELADVTACQGRLVEGVAMMRKALVLEPLNASFHFYTGQFLLAQGQTDEAITELKRAIQLQPSADGYRAVLGWALMRRGQFDQALAAVRADPGDADRLEALAMIWYTRGDKVRAQARLDELIRKDGDVGPGLVAAVYAFEGNTDQAFVWLDRGLKMKDPSTAAIYEAPYSVVQALRKDPRFAALCHKLGIPAPDEVDDRSASGPGHG
jgi:TolB-like protein/Tfp pilus assembly protein PilF